MSESVHGVVKSGRGFDVSALQLPKDNQWCDERNGYYGGVAWRPLVPTIVTVATLDLAAHRARALDGVGVSGLMTSTSAPAP